MRKFWFLFAFIAVFGLLFAAGDGSGGADVPDSPGYSASSDDGGGSPDEPFEAMADTTADIYIYVTLRQPPGPPPPGFYIFDTDCSVGAENVYFKSDLGPGERSDCDFYLVFRAPWALFEWSDIHMFSSSDTMQMIDPNEDPMTHFDAGMYRWGWKEEPAPGEDSVWVGPNYTYDFFGDSLLSASDNRGVCDPDTNWIYTAVAVDSNESSGNLLYSPYPAHPVGEFDQWLYIGKNILSYPVDIGDSTAKQIGEELDPYGVTAIYQWNASSQAWALVSNKNWIPFPPPGHWEWTGDANPLIPGAVFWASNTDGTDGQLWSTYTPGYLPKDADLPVHNLTKQGAATSGYNYVMMPYQEYNIILSTVGYFPIEAKDVLLDIPCAAEPDGAIYEYSNVTQARVLIANWNFIPFPPPGHWEATGPTPVYPGRPYIVVVNSDCTWPPY